MINQAGNVSANGFCKAMKCECLGASFDLAHRMINPINSVPGVMTTYLLNTSVDLVPRDSR